ncbi:MAG: hypothetical protein CV087_07375 [Candidatus Brocadia sp. WS118]|nr:MAG: hypothetical protein CV087_07375 [Candidatus Brocadia sp. WS118]
MRMRFRTIAVIAAIIAQANLLHVPQFLIEGHCYKCLGLICKVGFVYFQMRPTLFFVTIQLFEKFQQ